MSTARTVAKAVAALAFLGFAVAMLTAPTAAPVDPATLDNFSLCEAWQQSRTESLATLVRGRHMLLPEEFAAASNGQIFVGMSREGVTCALGQFDTNSSLTTADGFYMTRSYLRPDARRLIVQFQNGKVTAFGD